MFVRIIILTIVSCTWKLHVFFWSVSTDNPLGLKKNLLVKKASIKKHLCNISYKGNLNMFYPYIVYLIIHLFKGSVFGWTFSLALHSILVALQRIHVLNPLVLEKPIYTHSIIFCYFCLIQNRNMNIKEILPL